MMIHPLVRDLYKRVIIVSRDYPTTDVQHIKQLWKTAIRNPDNCPTWYNNDQFTGTTTGTNVTKDALEEEETNMDELFHAVHRGRQMVKEMIGIIQLHKYRCMKQRYNNNSGDSETSTIAAARELLAQYQNSMDHTTMSSTTTTTSHVEK